MNSVSETSVTNPSSYTVLIVENVLANRELYSRCLQADSSCRYTLLEAQSVTSAVLMCQNNQVDGILVDYILPDAMGLEFVQELRTRFAGTHPPVVMVANNSDPSIAVRAIKLGVEDYLLKQTLTPEQLQLSMRSAIENTRLRLQLQQQEERFRISIENMLDCFGIYCAVRDDRGQIIDFRIEYLNVAALNSNQMTTADIGKGLCEVLPAHRKTGLFAEYCRVVETGEPLVKEEVTYDDVFGTQYITHAYDIHASKLHDGLVISWRDVTDRKRLELELQQKVADLQQQQYRLQRLIDTAPIGIGIATASGEVRLMNDEMLRLHGYTREEFEQQGMNWRHFNSPELSTQAEQAMEQLQQNGFLPPTQKELVWRDGSQLPVWISAMQWLDGTDEHVAFAVDLKEQKQTEAELLKREELLNLFVKHSPAGVAMFDRQMHYILASDRWLTSYGLEGQDIIGRSHYEIFPELPERWKQIHQRCLAGAVETCAEDIFLHADGSMDWVRWEIHPWHTKNAEIGGIIIFSEVINERKRNEQRLQESQEQLQLGVQVAGLALARVDYTNHTIQLSPEAAALYGLSTEELVVTRDRIHATFHPEEQPMMAELIEQVLNPAGTGWFAYEHRVVWENGEVRWLNVRKQVFFARSGSTLRPSHAILAALDITERKQAEAEREQLLAQAQAARAEAEAANRSKDEFVAMVAHELRSPLNAILGWAQMLQRSSLDAKTTKTALETICRNTQVQVQLIEDLLDVSRMVRGTLQLKFAPVNLVNVVETAVETIRPTSEANSIQLTTQIQGTAPIRIWGDFTRLQQVVLNLLTNSLKFTPAGGQVKVLLALQNSQIHIQVSDTGKGIRPEFLPHIFERFRQDQQNATVKQGLGLGLAIVKYIVEQHSGTVTVQSQGEGKGSTFTVMLPLLSQVLRETP